MQNTSEKLSLNLAEITKTIKTIGIELGFQKIGITDLNLTTAAKNLKIWLARNFHGEMEYMAAHGTKRTHPQELISGTVRIITARINYLPMEETPHEINNNPHEGVIALYAQGRDYHKYLRKKLEKLAQEISKLIPQHSYRVFVDSAPVMEKPLAEKSGLGWIGKNTNLIDKRSGSWFFLGTIYTNLPLPIDEPSTNHCGSCHACIDICPTKAIVAPYQLDARRCISYLTIELRSAIPLEFRKAIGNRIFGCDDCQIVCPWNKFANYTKETAFLPRKELKEKNLIRLFNWTENEFVHFTQGSAIKRIGYHGWLRNIAIAMGNAPFDQGILSALENKKYHPSMLVREHVHWALDQQHRQRLFNNEKHNHRD